MPASAATTGRTAASLRAAIALSAEVSVSTIQSHADVASAPSTSSRQWPRSCRKRPTRAHGRPEIAGTAPAGLFGVRWRDRGQVGLIYGGHDADAPPGRLIFISSVVGMYGWTVTRPPRQGAGEYGSAPGVTFIKGTVIEADPAGALFTAIGAGNFRGLRPGSGRLWTLGPIELTSEDYQVDGALGPLAEARLSTDCRPVPVEKRCGSLAGKSTRSFSPAQPVNHVFPAHRDIPAVRAIVSTILSLGCAQHGRRVCTLCPHHGPRWDLVTGVAGRQNVRAMG